ncbi:dipeptide/oligopeptide/nickel ABC transporter ATP-binding protein [Paenibacillus sp. N4]|uniref:ABC transporter ATP-binding protein n=1 Tax=Paenibacillus vietnamensis TaxID=2590547 RepID=UPI001CD07A7E|nr:dipeptide/oligopeptide/nickel ABC transporter ATP-binding protein [Paenibacillus vietnamensis]MCA0756637.1 dipeptide/oligopeptide/nickel ABC transporter ATP-binding protein [Paenibacillus vietnamensis]
MKPLLTVKGLVRSYRDGKTVVPSVKGVSFTIGEGECVGLVGESGSGKSTVGRLLLALEKPDQGEVLWQGEPLTALGSRAMRQIRRQVQVVFQDPAAALNDRLPVWRSVMEPLDNYPDVCPFFLAGVRQSRKACAAKLFEMVGLQQEQLDRYPHELSGGQQQRVCLARGISLGPKLLICDEPTSGLDVTVQAGVLKLLKRLQRELGMSYLFISHDIAAVMQMSDRILVMRDGRIVDRFASGCMFNSSRHAYTKMLVMASQ